MLLFKALVAKQVLVVCTPWGRRWRFGRGSSCCGAHTLGRLLLAGGPGGDGLVITHCCPPHLLFFAWALVRRFVVPGAAVATTLAVAVAAIAVAAAAVAAAAVAAVGVAVTISKIAVTLQLSPHLLLKPLLHLLLLPM
jgi:hypothetical protein